MSHRRLVERSDGKKMQLKFKLHRSHHSKRGLQDLRLEALGLKRFYVEREGEVGK